MQLSRIRVVIFQVLIKHLINGSFLDSILYIQFNNSDKSRNYKMGMSSA